MQLSSFDIRIQFNYSLFKFYPLYQYQFLNSFRIINCQDDINIQRYKYQIISQKLTNDMNDFEQTFDKKINHKEL